MNLLVAALLLFTGAHCATPPQWPSWWMQNRNVTFGPTREFWPGPTSKFTEFDRIFTPPANTSTTWPTPFGNWNWTNWETYFNNATRFTPAFGLPFNYTNFSTYNWTNCPFMQGGSNFGFNYTYIFNNTGFFFTGFNFTGCPFLGGFTGYLNKLVALPSWEFAGFNWTQWTTTPSFFNTFNWTGCPMFNSFNGRRFGGFNGTFNFTYTVNTTGFYLTGIDSNLLGCPFVNFTGFYGYRFAEWPTPFPTGYNFSFTGFLYNTLEFPPTALNFTTPATVPGTFSYNGYGAGGFWGFNYTMLPSWYSKFNTSMFPSWYSNFPGWFNTGNFSNYYHRFEFQFLDFQMNQTAPFTSSLVQNIEIYANVTFGPHPSGNCTTFASPIPPTSEGYAQLFAGNYNGGKENYINIDRTWTVDACGSNYTSGYIDFWIRPMTGFNAGVFQEGYFTCFFDFTFPWYYVGKTNSTWSPVMSCYSGEVNNYSYRFWFQWRYYNVPSYECRSGSFMFI